MVIQGKNHGDPNFDISYQQDNDDLNAWLAHTKLFFQDNDYCSMNAMAIFKLGRNESAVI